MRKHWFTCRVSYQKLSETGAESKVTESYLVDSYTYTEAEARITMRMRELVSSPFEVVNIAKSNLAEVFFNDAGDAWYKVKVALIFYDEDSGKEKQQNQYYLIESNDVKDAYEKTEKVLEGSISSYVVASITFTKILDVFLSSETTVPEGHNMAKLTPASNFDGEIVPGPPRTPESELRRSPEAEAESEAPEESVTEETSEDEAQ